MRSLRRTAIRPSIKFAWPRPNEGTSQDGAQEYRVALATRRGPIHSPPPRPSYRRRRGAARPRAQDGAPRPRWRSSLRRTRPGGSSNRSPYHPRMVRTGVSGRTAKSSRFMTSLTERDMVHAKASTAPPLSCQIGVGPLALAFCECVGKLRNARLQRSSLSYPPKCPITSCHRRRGT